MYDVSNIQEDSLIFYSERFSNLLALFTQLVLRVVQDLIVLEKVYCRLFIPNPPQPTTHRSRCDLIKDRIATTQATQIITTFIRVVATEYYTHGYKDDIIVVATEYYTHGYKGDIRIVATEYNTHGYKGDIRVVATEYYTHGYKSDISQHNILGSVQSA